MAGNTTEWEFTGNSKILKKAIEDAITVFKGLDTQSKGTTAALGKLEGQLDDLTDTSKSSGKALDKVRDKFQNIGDTGGDVDSILMGMTGVLEKIDPRLAAVATSAGEMSAGIESVSRVIATANPVMIGITAVVLAVSIAYNKMTAKTEASAAAQKIAKERTDNLKKAYGKLSAKLRDLAIDYKVYNKDLTETEANSIRAANALKADFAEALDIQTDALDAANVSLKEQEVIRDRNNKKIETATVGLDNYRDSLKRSGLDEEKIARRVENYKARILAQLGLEKESVDRLTKVRDNAQTQLNHTLKTRAKAIEMTVEMIEGDARKAKAEKASAAAATESGKAYEFNVLQMLAALTSSEALAEGIIDLTNRAIAPTLTATEQLDLKYADMTRGMEALKKEAERRVETMQGELDLAIANEAAEADLALIRAVLTSETSNAADAGDRLIEIQKALAEAQDQLKDKMDKAGKAGSDQGFVFDEIHDKGGRWIDKIKDLRGELAELEYQQLSGADVAEHYDEVQAKLAETFEDLGEASANASAYMADMFGNAITLMMQQGDELTAKQKDNILMLYRAQQAAAISTIGIDTLVAMSKALAELGPIAGAVAAGMIFSGGLINAGIVASTPPPQFHVGGIIPSSSTLVNALPGESILNRETTAQLGAGGVASLNSGGAGGAMVIEQVYGHRVFNRFIVDNLASGGPLKKQIVGNTRVGHRVRSTS
tara:strand:- start:1903 stop:4050 length:2148 start_codon:yes stop_codon:yes gene_type:complete